jgi:hypothetical protein
MGKILGNIATTPTPRSDWAQTDTTKVDYIRNKPTKLSEFENDAEYASTDYIDEATTTQSQITVQLGTNGTVGGYKTGDVIAEGTSIQSILNRILQKSVPATYTKPTVSIANNGGQASGNVETGTSITPKLKATFTQNDAGALTAISILKGSGAVANGTVSPLTYSGDAIVIGDETISFTASASYAAAPVKNDNLGNESKDNWFGAGTVTSGAYSITGKRNAFYGTGVGDLPAVTSDLVRGLSGKKLAPAASTTFTINVAVGQQYVVFAYPATLRDVNKVTYVEANDGGMAGNFTKTTIDVADARGGENGLMSYKVYTYVMAVPAAATMTFTVVI